MIGVITDVFSLLLDMTVGWFFSNITNNLGGIKLKSELIMLDIEYRVIYEEWKYDVPPKCIGKIPDFMNIEFNVIAYNSKNQTSGMSDCKVILEYSDGSKFEIGNLFNFENDVNELENLLNIESKTTVKVKYCQREMLWNPERLRSGLKVYLEYRISGNEKIRTFKIYETKSLEF